jgi:Carboxypeptidase regulatory-like domain
MRYACVVGALVLLIGGCNLWVALHNDGVVRGRVVQADGRPAAGATVSFWEKTLTTLERRTTTETGSDGHFVVTGQAAHHFALQAEKSGLGASPRTLYRRYFRGQNLVLDEPLRLREGR